MARRKSIYASDDLHDLFMVLPWWIPVAAATFLYILLRYVMPAIWHGRDLMSLVIVPLGAAFAPLAALVILLAGVAAAWSRRKRRAILEHQTSLESIRAMSWQEFELLVGETYRRQGYAVEERGGGGADGGVDLMLRREHETVLVQCKRWRTRQVNVSHVRELYGVMASERATGGIFVTSGRYTADARAFAQGKPLELIDGSALLVLVKNVQSGRAAISVQETESTVSGIPLCPRCSGPMVLRTARQGENAGSQFWGCSSFPQCRGTRKVAA